MAVKEGEEKGEQLLLSYCRGVRKTNEQATGADDGNVGARDGAEGTTWNDGGTQADDGAILKGQPHVKSVEILNNKIYINK